MYDLIIIGMGISGISAAIYAHRSGLNVLILEENAPGGTINKIAEIENYPGFNKISGPDLAMNLFNTINDLNIPYKLETVTDVILEEIKTVKTKNNVYQSHNLLIATGRKPRLLPLEHIEEYLGHGISTCALCDGALYKNKDVAVIGGGSSALSEALYLSKIVNKVYLIHRRDEFRGEETLINAVQKSKNITLILNNEITSLIIENAILKGIKLKDQELNIAALFIYIGSDPNTKFLANTALKMEDGYILTNYKGETNIPGVYASGDCTKKEIYQIVNAASEGAIAALNIAQK